MKKWQLYMILNLANFCYCSNFPDYEFLHQATGQSRAELEEAINWINWYWNNIFHGWQQYYNVLPALINKHDLKIGCEIGIAYGTHSAHILKTTNILKLYSIDPFKHFEQGYNDGMNYPQKYFDVLFYKVKDLLSQFGSRSSILRMTSIEGSNQFSKHSLDFVFIDANHSYEALKEDLNAWYDKVKPGGLLSGDDYLPNFFPGLVQAVNEFFQSKGLSINQDKEQPRIWWVIKP